MVRGIVGPSLEADAVAMRPDVAEAMAELRAFLFDTVYLGAARGEQEKAAHVLESLYRHYRTQTDELQPSDAPGDEEQRVADYVSGMTDRFAIRDFERLFVPGGL
jgi:dGTPase